MTTPLRYALYRRVSKPSQVAKDLSLPEQAAEMHTHVQAKSGVIAREFEDRGISAEFADDRPQFLAMHEAALGGEFDVILIHNSDRAFRNHEEAVIFKAAWRRAGVRAESVTEPWYGGTEPGEQILENVFDIFNADYLRKLSRETHKGLRAASKIGRQNGRPTYGYQWKPTRKGWDVNEEEAAWVRFIYRGCLDGKRCIDIARDLNALGIPPPSTREAIHGKASTRCRQMGWYTSSVKAILHNRRLTGFIHYKGDWFPGAHEAIVDCATFERVQMIVERRAKGRVDTSAGLFVGGLLSCPVCWGLGIKQPMHRVRNSSARLAGIDRYYGYCCGAVKKWLVQRNQGQDVEARPCTGFSMREMAIVKVVKQSLESVIAGSDPEILEREAKHLQPVTTTVEDLRTQTATLQRELDAIPSEQAGYVRLAARGSISDAALDAFLEEAEKRSHVIRSAICEIAHRIDTPVEPTPAHAYALLSILNNEGLTPIQKRDGLNTWLHHIVPWGSKEGATLYWRL